MAGLRAVNGSILSNTTRTEVVGTQWLCIFYLTNLAAQEFGIPLPTLIRGKKSDQAPFGVATSCLEATIVHIPNAMRVGAKCPCHGPFRFVAPRRIAQRMRLQAVSSSPKGIPLLDGLLASWCKLHDVKPVGSRSLGPSATYKIYIYIIPLWIKWSVGVSNFIVINLETLTLFLIMDL